MNSSQHRPSPTVTSGSREPGGADLSARGETGYHEGLRSLSSPFEPARAHRTEEDRAAHAAYVRGKAAARRAAFFADKRCLFCGSGANLEIDHVDPSTKEDHRIWSWAPGRAAAELAKCRVLCGPCHRHRHAEERRTTTHGTVWMYNRYHCRCEPCRAAKSASRLRASFAIDPTTGAVTEVSR